MKTISAKELAEIFNTMAKTTVETYLSSYKFNKFRASCIETPRCRFYISQDFLNTLYTLLWHKNRVGEAQKLKKHFKEFDIDIIPFEEFVK
jgi:hypothetical protein